MNAGCSQFITTKFLLAKLGYLNQFVESSDNFYIPQSVADEIGAKLDPATKPFKL
jgi:hypothetical protein